MKASEHKDWARTESRRLVGQYYEELGSEEHRNRKVVYMFTSGLICELFRAFDFRIVLPEVNALQCSITNIAVDMIRHGESLGYVDDICSYCKSDLGLMTGPHGGDAPFGKIPSPDLVLITNGGCSTYIKWGEALSREYNCPVKMVDVPFMREDRPAEFDRPYVRSQIEDLVPFCEDITGIKFDIDKLKGILELTAETISLWKSLIEYGKRRPSPLDGYFGCVTYMAPMTMLRGTRDAVDFYSKAVGEMEERVSLGYSPVRKEKYRLLIEGSLPWPKFREFREMFQHFGAVPVVSTYVRVSCACEELESGPDDPMDYLADLAGQSLYNWNHEKRLRFLEQLAKEFEVDGAIAHSSRSCRPFSIGQLDLRNYFAGQLGIPTLFLDSDIADPRYFSTARIFNRMNAFFEVLAVRKDKAVRRG